MNNIDEVLKKYRERLGERIDLNEIKTNETFSREYLIFRKEFLGKTSSFYEAACKFAEKIIKIKPKEKDEEELLKSIEIAHLDITPVSASSLAALTAILLVLFAVIIGVVSYAFGSLSLSLPLFLVLIGFVLIKPLSKLPIYLANKWRLNASNQMVLCILYVVMYMRHTSNLEHAIKFTGEHISVPLALDLRKIFWDVEIGKISTIKESLDNYLKQWRDHNLEFVEAFHLVEGSLYEPNEGRRVDLLDKALQVMLDGTYDKMMHFAHNLKSPVTMLYMLGIILPILGLVIFPLISSFMQGLIKWYHLAILYNVLLPIFVYVMGINVLAKRPTGYGGSFTEEKSFEGYGKGAGFLAAIIIFIFLFIGFLPIILHYSNPELDQAGFLEESMVGGKFLDYKCDGICQGPFGLGALLLSLFVPFGIALGYSSYCRLKSNDLVKVRERTKRLEAEFNGSLFQLGNRVADGIPVEVAFGDVAENMKGTPTGEFFRLVNVNIRSLGMGVKEAIFNKSKGAITEFPSNLIESSMKVLVEGAKKGPSIVANSLISISVYVDRIHKVNERLKDLLADIISSMKSQVSFLTPIIAGIVVGVSSMVVNIINKLGEQVSEASLSGQETQFGNLANVLDIIRVEHVVPGFYFQIVVGLFVVEITIILTILSNAIENGLDKVSEKNALSKNLFIGVGLYVIIALIGIFVFNILANGINLISG